MDHRLPVPSAPPPLSWPLRLALVLLMPLWLPLLGILLAFGILFAEDDEPSPDPTPEPDDDGRPADWVPPFVPPAPSASAEPWRLRPVAPKAPALAEPSPAVIETRLPSHPPTLQPIARTSCWPRSFPAG